MVLGDVSPDTPSCARIRLVVDLGLGFAGHHDRNCFWKDEDRNQLSGAAYDTGCADWRWPGVPDDRRKQIPVAHSSKHPHEGWLEATRRRLKLGATHRHQ